MSFADAEVAMRKMDGARVASKIQPSSDGCWEWRGCRNREGYGRVRWEGWSQQAHRVVYTLLVGVIPAGLHLDHLCRNTACVNPAHLEAVSARENIRRGVSPVAARAKQTHCKHGHEFTPENTYVKADGNRDCRACHRARTRARKAASR